MRLRLLAFASFVTLLFAAPSSGAAGPLHLEITSLQEQEGRIVAVMAATTADGKPITDLPASAVVASIDGQPLAISSVQPASATTNAIGIVLVADVSGSMA